MYGGPGTSSLGQIVYTNVTLKFLVGFAYGVTALQLSTPSWMDEEHFDIVAKVPAGATRADMLPMLQSLLEERFQLKVRHELRETQAYALTVGKNGSKMKAYPMLLPEGVLEGGRPKFTGVDKDGLPIIAPGQVTGVRKISNGQTRISMTLQPMKQVTDILSYDLRQPIVDQTGLTGRYDFHLTFATEGGGALPAVPDGGDLSTAPPQASDPAPTLISAVESQLGLKLERKKLPVDFLVVDHAEKQPTEN